ncbi:futalosine hydrolase [Desulfurispirillum indicum]|uniref:futalosine hydrolase n=1 Tax=Desulfurispirillum indicum TaxID=936456 RepID=UPI001CFAD853|nr:futalosine hydrolase [Desulfurispirillum indicum]UCZ55797.1 futalosine hydrolase [Desulfurispirillum indicum]
MKPDNALADGASTAILILVASELELQGLTLTLPSRVQIACTGVGKIASAVETTLQIRQWRPELVISAGIGGYYGSALELGDLALITRELLIDEGVATAGGFLSMETLGFQRCTIHSPAAVPPVFDQLPFAQRHIPGATVSTVSGTQKMADERYGAFLPAGICENMEGAAVAWACQRAEVPWIGIRALSNFVEERDLERWNIPLALASLSAYLELFLQEYSPQ